MVIDFWSNAAGPILEKFFWDGPGYYAGGDTNGGGIVTYLKVGDSDEPRNEVELRARMRGLGTVTHHESNPTNK